jgi:hypothetical protein
MTRPSPRAPTFNGHRLDEKSPSARPARKTSPFDRRPLEGRQRPKKPGPSLLQAASPVGRGAPVRLRLPVFQGRLTGLLSRSPPTDTRPQARAYWASLLFVRIALKRKWFFQSSRIILLGRHAIVGTGEFGRRAGVCGPGSAVGVPSPERCGSGACRGRRGDAKGRRRGAGATWRRRPVTKTPRDDRIQRTSPF